jgi:hypothetical protein
MSKFENALKGIEKETPAANAPKAPRGYRIVREGKTFQTSIVMRASTREAIDDIRAELGKSRNDLINTILEEYIENYYKERA